MDVQFTFAGDGGPPDRITVANCSADLYAALQDAAAGNSPESVFTIEASANGGGVRPYLFRSSRISDVQEIR